VAGYKKNLARELQHDRFRDTTMTVLDRLLRPLLFAGEVQLPGTGRW